MKDDFNDEVPKILISSDRVLSWDGVSKLGDKPEGDRVTHFWGSIERPITWS
jgi:hypothetical protein